jgi:hypothetical protein
MRAAGEGLGRWQGVGEHGEVTPAAQRLGQLEGRGADVERHHLAVLHHLRRNPGDGLFLGHALDPPREERRLDAQGRRQVGTAVGTAEPPLAFEESQVAAHRRLRHPEFRREPGHGQGSLRLQHLDQPSPSFRREHAPSPRRLG